MAIQDKKAVVVGADGKKLDEKALKELQQKIIEGGDAKQLSLFSAITDTKFHATIDTGDGKANASVFFGQHIEGTSTNVLDFSDIALLDASENEGGLSGADVVGHETVEAWLTARGLSTKDAHDFQQNPFGGLILPERYKDNYNDKGLVVGKTGNFGIAGREGVFARITVEFLTPIPRNAVPPKEAHVVHVEKVDR